METQTVVSSEQLKVKSNFEAIANAYGEQFIAERIGYYALEFFMCTLKDIDSHKAKSIGLNLNIIRINMLSFFNRPGTGFQLFELMEEDGWQITRQEIRSTLKSLLKLFIGQISIHEKSDDGVTRKDIDFILDVMSALN